MRHARCNRKIPDMLQFNLYGLIMDFYRVSFKSLAEKNSILAYDVEGDLDAGSICLTLFAGSEYATIYLTPDEKGLKRLEKCKSYLEDKVLLVWDSTLESKFVPKKCWMVDCQIPKMNQKLL